MFKKDEGYGDYMRDRMKDDPPCKNCGGRDNDCEACDGTGEDHVRLKKLKNAG